MHRRVSTHLLFVAVAAALFTVVAAPIPAEADERVARRVHCMGTWLDMIIEARDRDSALAAAEAAVRAVEAAESRLSTWREDSELSRLNRSPAGSWFLLSTELAADLGEVIEWHRRTAGWFNPGVAALVRAWGLRGDGRFPGDDEISRAVAASRIAGLVFAEGRACRTVEDFEFEEGGFGKGVALRDASSAALARGARCTRFNFGGQTHLAGECAAEIVEIAHPRQRDIVIGSIEITAGSVATSGNSERGIVVGGQRIGHLLDPKSGRPAPDFGSVTVFAADPVAADCSATALYAMGPRQGAGWLSSRTGPVAVYAVADGTDIELWVSEALIDRLDVESQGVRVRVLESLETPDPADRSPPAAPAS